jgi:CheY-like chemotaxis protein
MATSKMKIGLRGIMSRGKLSFAEIVRNGSILIFVLALGWADLARAEDAEAFETSSPNKTNYANFQTALRDQMHAEAEMPQERHAESGVSTWNSFLITIEVSVCALLMLRLLLPKIGKLMDERTKMISVATAEAKAVIEEKAVALFATELQIEPKSLTEALEQRKAILDEFFKAVPDQLAAMRNLFADIGRSADPADRQKTLGHLNTEVTALKNRVGSLELTAAWHLASSVEKLLGQLSEKSANITPSSLRTAAGGLLLLSDLCVPGLRKDLATEPPVRFLAVDDDPISRRAVSMCLKKIAQAPDLAEHGEAALELAERQTYDAIFLDVEMPGLDGFEVCTKIHKLGMNKVTPVVFVTSHSDFDSRAKSTSSGGRDLIAKPFLSAEITLKAITLLFRARLEREKASRELSAKAAVESDASSLTKEATKVTQFASKEPGIAPAGAKESAKPAIADNSKNGDNKASSEIMATARKDQKSETIEEKSADSTPSRAKEFAKSFAVHGTEHLKGMLEQVSALSVTNSSEERRKILGELYVGLNMLRSEAARTGLKAVCELASALGKLISKLLDKPTLFTPSTLQAISAAIRLLEEIAPGSVEPDLSNPPVRALVVDDEPLTRRAISNALQLTFGKPDNAENGEAAVALTQSKVFDVIFLDIMMPEMDGFETCSKIRETKLNGSTPVIFVTSHKDTESRDKAFDCGGNGFISKPVLPAEIFLTALTYTLRARMGKDKATTHAEILEEAVC